MFLFVFLIYLLHFFDITGLWKEALGEDLPPEENDDEGRCQRDKMKVLLVHFARRRFVMCWLEIEFFFAFFAFIVT